MTPEEIRRALDEEEAATDAEAAATHAEAITDPVVARAHWTSLVALAPRDPALAQLLSAALADLLIALVSERVADDDAFALKVSATLFEAEEKIAASVRRRQREQSPPPRTPRGKPRTPGMA